jgi:hypothetical protein
MGIPDLDELLRSFRGRRQGAEPAGADRRHHRREQIGLQANVVIDPAGGVAARRRIQDIDNALNKRLSQRQISTIYSSAISIASSSRSIRCSQRDPVRT